MLVSLLGRCHGGGIVYRLRLVRHQILLFSFLIPRPIGGTQLVFDLFGEISGALT